MSIKYQDTEKAFDDPIVQNLILVEEEEKNEDKDENKNEKEFDGKQVIMMKTRRTLVEIMKMMSSIWIIMWFNHLNFLIDFMIEFLIEFPYMIDFSFIKTAANFLLFMGFKNGSTARQNPNQTLS